MEKAKEASAQASAKSAEKSAEADASMKVADNAHKESNKHLIKLEDKK